MVSENCSCDQLEGITGMSPLSTWVGSARQVFGVREVQEMQPEPSLWPPTCALGRDGVWDKARGRVIIAAFGGALPRSWAASPRPRPAPGEAAPVSCIACDAL